MQSLSATILENVDSVPDEQTHAILVKRKNFRRYGGVFEFLFGELDEIHVSRQNVFNAFDQEISKGCLMALAWGFPKGVLPAGKSLSPAIEAIDFFADHLTMYASSIFGETEYNKFNSIKGVKNGVTTKLLYFSRTKTRCGNCLIYDSRIRNYLIDKQPSEFDHVTPLLRKTEGNPGGKIYCEYICILNSVAELTGIKPAQIERYMFENSPLIYAKFS